MTSKKGIFKSGGHGGYLRVAVRSNGRADSGKDHAEGFMALQVL